MNKTKKIYFLSAFVLIIACYALNLSYSLFVDTKEKDIVDSSVPTLNTTLSVSSVPLDANSEIFIKQIITNNASISTNYALNYTCTDCEIKLINGESTNVTGTLTSNSSITLYFYIKNNSSTSNNITFTLDKNYTTIKNTLSSNIDITNKYTLSLCSSFTAFKSSNTNYQTVSNNSTLACTIYTSAINNANNANATTLEQTNHYAVYRESPTTTVAESINNENEASLSKTEDYNADGTQNDYSYYFRGNVENNYVTFAGMCWRVVRIDGSGNIKIIIEDQDEVCSSTMTGDWNIPTTTGGSTKADNFGYDASTYSGKTVVNYLNPVTESSSAQVTAYKNFQTGVLSSYLDKLVSGNWCYDDLAYTLSTGGTVIEDKSTYYTNGTTFYYDSYVRLYGKSTKEPTLKCNGTILNKYSDNTDMYVATLTVDEIVYAGGKLFTNNQNYYLLNNWQNSNYHSFWSSSPNQYYGNNDYAFSVNYRGDVGSDYVNYNNSIRPAVVLNSSITATGDGTVDNAYVVS